MLTIAIQAGGQSRRMGRDKALMKLAGKPLIEHILERIDGLGDEILITTNHPRDYAYLGVRLVSDPKPGAGALSGLHTALSAANGLHVLLLACDMPFINRPLLEFMIGVDPEADVVVPQHGHYFEPLHALYRQTCLQPVETSLREGRTRVVSFYPSVQTYLINEDALSKFDPKGLSFFNINTPEDLAHAEEIFKTLSRSHD